MRIQYIFIAKTEKENLKTATTIPNTISIWDHPAIQIQIDMFRNGEYHCFGLSLFFHQ